MLRTSILTVVAALTMAAQPSGDDVIKKNIDAQGGAEKLKTIKTLQMTGKAIFAGGQLEAPMVYRSKRPARYRTEIQIQGNHMIEGFDGTVKWLSDGKNPSKTPEESAKTAGDNADVIGSPLFNYREKGNTVELTGKEDSDGTPCYKFKVKLKSGNLATVYVDAKTFLTFKIVTKAGDLEAESKLGDYRRLDNVMIPFSNSIKINNQAIMRTQYDKAEINVPMDDSLFAFPSKK